MTIILNCLTPSLVIQASDRRLTWLSGHLAGKLAEDDQNKAVLFCDSASIAYTGLANLGTNLEIPTDLWISKVLRRFQANQGAQAFEAIRHDATEVFLKLRARYDDADLRHAFVAIGWERFGNNPALRPYEITITNAQNAQGKWMQRSEPLFSTRVRPLSESETYFVGVAGQELLWNEERDLNRLIRTCVERRLGPGAFARVLVAAVRRVARRNSAVGRRILVTSLPQPVSATRRRNLMVLTSTIGRFGSDNPMFMYYRENSGNGVLYGPHFVCNGSVASNFTVNTRVQPDHTVVEPPWLTHAIVMSPRIQIYNSQFDGPENIALLTQDYHFDRWSLFASVGNNPPGPCIIQVPGDFDRLQEIFDDRRFLVLTCTAADAGLAADCRWLADVRSWLARERIAGDLLESFVKAVAGFHRGRVILELRHLFDQLEHIPDSAN